MNEKETNNNEHEDRVNWRAAIAGLILGILLALIFFLGGWGNVRVNGEDTSAQAAAALLAEQVAEEGGTLTVEQSTDEEGNTVIGMWVGEAPTAVVRITPAEEGEEPTSTTTPVNPGGDSIKGPWDSPMWRGDKPGEDDPTPGVTKMFWAPIQGVGGPGGSSGGSGGESGGGNGPGGPPGGEE